MREGMRSATIGTLHRIGEGYEVSYHDDDMEITVERYLFTSLDSALYSVGRYIEGVGILDEDTALSHMEAPND